MVFTALTLLIFSMLLELLELELIDPSKELPESF